MTSSLPRRLVRLAALTIFIVSAAWALALTLTGGIDWQLFGRKISSHGFRRPLLVATVSFAILTLAGGLHDVVRAWLAPEAWIGRLTRAARARVCAVLVAALMSAVAIGGIAIGPKVAGGSDSCGYLSQAELWLKRDPRIRQPWAQDAPWPNALSTFAPLGYVLAIPPTFQVFGYAPAFQPSTFVPFYSPGLPMLMAGAKAIGGNPALYFVVPLCGALLVLATYGIGRRLGSPVMGAIAAFLVATSPTVLQYSWDSMSDVPVAAAWAVAWWAVLGRSLRSAWAASLALIAALLIRPDRVPLAAAIALWVAIDIARHTGDRAHYVRRGAIILGGLATGAAAVALLFWRWYGSPFNSGAGGFSTLFSAAGFLTNLDYFVRQFATEQTVVPFVGLLALFVPARRLWPGASDRAATPVLGLFAVVVWGEFALIAPGIGTRFLLPSYAPIMIGLAAVVVSLLRRRWRGSWTLAMIGLAVLGLNGITQASRTWVFDPAGIEAQYAGVGERVRAVTPENSVVFTIQHSCSVRYYAGRVILRWDQLWPEWLDRSLAWFADRRVHSYAVVDDFEIEQLRKQFAGQKSLSKFQTPIFRMNTTSVYDLDLPEGATVATEAVAPPPRRRFGIPPAPPPTRLFPH